MSYRTVIAALCLLALLGCLAPRAEAAESKFGAKCLTCRGTGQVMSVTDKMHVGRVACRACLGTGHPRVTHHIGEIPHVMPLAAPMRPAAPASPEAVKPAPPARSRRQR